MPKEKKYNKIDGNAIEFGKWISDSGYLQAGSNFWSHSIRKNDEKETHQLYEMYLHSKKSK